MRIPIGAWIAFSVVTLVLTAHVRPGLANTYDEVEFVRVVDGNTFAAKIQVWPGISQKAVIRLRGVDVPATRGKCAAEKTKALEAKKALGALLEKGAITIAGVDTRKNILRVTADVFIGRTNVSEQTIRDGHGRIYHGGDRGSWCE